jgi:tricorn protease
MRYAPLVLAASLVATTVHAQGTRLLRQPTVSATQIAFAYAGDIWIVGKDGGDARRLTSFAGTESNPHFSPDGKQIAFTMQYGANNDVYVIDASGGTPRRLTWHPGADLARGWSPDGKRVLFSSARAHAPAVGVQQLWTVAASGGVPERLPLPDALRGSYSADGQRLAYEKVSRWDVEWRNYRGGQTHPISIYNLATQAVDTLPSPGSLDLWPAWMGDAIYFISDRDWAANVWKYDVGTKQLTQVTHYKDFDVKTLDAGSGAVVYEQAGYLHLLDPVSGNDRQLSITPRVMGAIRVDAGECGADRVSVLSPSGAPGAVCGGGRYSRCPRRGGARNLTRSPGAPTIRPSGRPTASKSPGSRTRAANIASDRHARRATRIKFEQPTFATPTGRPTASTSP